MAAHNAHHPPGYLPPGYAPPEQQSLIDLSRLYNLTGKQIGILVGLGVLCVLVNATFYRLSSILLRPKPEKKARQKSGNGGPHLLIVLGSGGHTAEMLDILRTNINVLDFSRRTYVVSSGDGFSAAKAAEFEKSLGGIDADKDGNEDRNKDKEYDIVTVRRARKVHQSFLTTPFSAAVSLYDCFKAVGSSPDLIITNGPGTGVCIVVAAIIRLFFGVGDVTKMRTIFIESWARVKTLSLSGRILKPLVDRFIVQWPQLQKKEGARAEFVGQLLS